ncbi:hypothetical protein PPERSA_13149 [Pseudocohnilembus persalinus]|uniref:Band 7 domain-containing protein n=1 Tax=Pseudocohnilembus persalinus TaxID=266149 RepID=A0A0V0QBM7_PSEPJ|nr:hypothetical protein PPERSA_13149 [Pseudocohnilembus persalinus]|eukprot:KRW99569.1 hypothetical protein PPERSA_13149 [Pseudocohnilembus persalinus]
MQKNLLNLTRKTLQLNKTQGFFIWQNSVFKRLIIPKGDQYAILKNNGEIDIIKGPQKKIIYSVQYQKLQKYTAAEGQYIEIEHENGQKEIISSPATVYKHPTEHNYVLVSECIKASKGENIILLEKNEKTGQEKYKIVQGPVTYTPKINEIYKYIQKDIVADQSQYLLVQYLNGDQETVRGPITMTKDPNIHSKISLNMIENIPNNQGYLIYRETEQGKVNPVYIYGPAQYIKKNNEILHCTFRKLTANGDQFIRVIQQNGEIQTFPGPYEMWEDPIKYQQITIEEYTQINSGEAIVVYQEKQGQLSRKIIYGPAQYFPKGSEWIHNFSWHGALKNDQGLERKKPNALQFTKLRMISQSVYYDVENVRTQDDAPLTVKLMIFYTLKDINKMLENTYDPIGEFINGVSADVIEEVGQYDFEIFKQKIERLNQTETYKYLLEKAEQIGYEITKIVCKGYVCTPKIEQMHYSAIEKRTQLVLDTETQEQEQKLKDFILQQDKNRLKEESQVQKDKLQNNLELQQIQEQKERDKQHKEFQQQYEQAQKQFEQQQNLQKIQQENQISHQEQLNQIEIQKQIKLQEIQLNKLKEKSKIEVEKIKYLHSLGVDLSKYLIAKEQGRPDKWLQIDTKPDNHSQLHLHEDTKNQ